MAQTDPQCAGGKCHLRQPGTDGSKVRDEISLTRTRLSGQEWIRCTNIETVFMDIVITIIVATYKTGVYLSQ